MTDEELLTEASRGDEAAFVELYRRHRDAVFRFAYRVLGSIEPAEDIAHDCFLSLIQQPHRFDPARGSLRTYLFGAARNLAMKHFRRTGHDAVNAGERDAFGRDVAGRKVFRRLLLHARHSTGHGTSR